MLEHGQRFAIPVCIRNGLSVTVQAYKSSTLKILIRKSGPVFLKKYGSKSRYRRNTDRFTNIHAYTVTRMKFFEIFHACTESDTEYGQE